VDDPGVRTKDPAIFTGLTFTFDRVFGLQHEQQHVYDYVGR
jgi:hypothetical protein